LIFPGFEIDFLAWIALVPLLLLIRHSDPTEVLLSSLAVGFIFYGGLLWWALRVDGINPFNFSFGMVASACYFGVFGLLAHYLQKRIPQWNALTFPAIWVVLEYLRSHLGFLSLPWGILGYSQYSYLPVIRISAFSGVYGVSYLIVMVNTVLAEILHPYFSRTGAKVFRGIPIRSSQKTSLGVLAAGLIFLSLSLLYGSPSLSEKSNSPSLKVGLVQGNVYSNENNDSRYREMIFQKYYRLTLRAADSRPDFIAWPSSSVPGGIPYDRMLVRMLAGLATKTRAFLLVGSSGYDKFNPQQRKSKRMANSAFLLAPHGNIVGRYDKIWLLPFDEYLPLRGYVRWPSWIVSNMIDTQPGRELTIFRMNKLRFGVLICWESLFPDLFRKMAAPGVEFMVSMTNEGFTDIPAAHYQMLAMNVFRAAENGVSVIRTASTGVSAIIEPSGRITARVQDHEKNDVNVEGYLLGHIQLRSDRTFYNRYGDWFVYSLSAMLVGFILLAFVKKPNPRETDLYESR
jgi:apolipoprotein N-acyltransferase